MFNVGNWQPHIGDASVVGWFTVVSYYVCAALCMVHWVQGRSRLDRSEARFPISLAALVALLGVTKQFNLPGAFAELGRIGMHQIGGYDSRRWLQAVLLVLFAVGAIMVARRSARNPWFRMMWQRRAPEIVCVVYLCALGLLRAVSLHQVGALFAVEIFGVRVNWIVELGGIYALISVVVIRILTSPKRAQ